MRRCRCHQDIMAQARLPSTRDARISLPAITGQYALVLPSPYLPGVKIENVDAYAGRGAVVVRINLSHRSACVLGAGSPANSRQWVVWRQFAQAISVTPKATVRFCGEMSHMQFFQNPRDGVPGGATPVGLPGWGFRPRMRCRRLR
jgi:hypothetical protein